MKPSFAPPPSSSSSSSSSALSNHKALHPIYIALESQQYNKAIKLCLASPSLATHPLAQALLAHAYLKAGQRYKCLLTLQALLQRGASVSPAGMANSDDAPSVGSDYFPELQLELKYCMERRDFIAVQQQQQQQQLPLQPASSLTSPAASKSGSGKKGKKKGSATATAASTTTLSSANGNSSNTLTDSTEDSNTFDLIDQFDIAPSLSDTGEQLPPPNPIFTDETLLSTLAMTLRSHLRLPWTAYQLYCWASASSMSSSNNTFDAQQATLVLLGKAFLAGCFVLVHPKYQSSVSSLSRSSSSSLLSPIAQSTLANMQVLALQMARLQQQLYGMAPATAWAAQTALWQVPPHPAKQLNDYTNPSDGADAKTTQRLLMLPRLAESLALKCIQERYGGSDSRTAANHEETDPKDEEEEDSLMVTENFLLYLRTLDQQGKWEEKLSALEERLEAGSCLSSGNSNPRSKTRVYPPRSTLLDLKAEVLQTLGRYEEARDLIASELLQEYPDNWSYWKRYLQCSLEEEGGIPGKDNTNDTALQECLNRTARLVEQVQSHASNNVGEGCSSDANPPSTYPLRGPDLMKVELAAECVRRCIAASTEDGGDAAQQARISKHVSALRTSIMEYGGVFAPRSSCTFADLGPYLDLFLQATSSTLADGCEGEVTILLEWLKRVGMQPSSADARERRKELRLYIFSLQMLYKTVRNRPQLFDEWIPSWTNLIRVWKEFQAFDTVTDDDQVCTIAWKKEAFVSKHNVF